MADVGSRPVRGISNMPILLSDGGRVHVRTMSSDGYWDDGTGRRSEPKCILATATTSVSPVMSSGEDFHAQIALATIREFNGPIGMDATTNSGTAKILCVERDVAVLQGRCTVLKNAGYDASSASPNLAEVLLRSRKFDLIILSTLSDSDLQRIINFADGADVLVFDRFTSPSELLSLVAQRLNRRQRKA
jgi:hypothetical protein